MADPDQAGNEKQRMAKFHIRDEDGRASLWEQPDFLSAEERRVSMAALEAMDVVPDSRWFEGCTPADIRRSRLHFPLDTKGVLVRRPCLVVFGKICRSGRSVGFFSDEAVAYRYSGQQMDAQPIPPWMQMLLAKTNSFLGTRFNAVLVNFYADGNDQIMAHSDDEDALDHARGAVAAISIGAERTFVVQRKSEKSWKLEIPTREGSCS